MKTESKTSFNYKCGILSMHCKQNMIQTILSYSAQMQEEVA